MEASSVKPLFVDPELPPSILLSVSGSYIHDSPSGAPEEHPWALPSHSRQAAQISIDRSRVYSDDTPHTTLPPTYNHAFCGRGMGGMGSNPND